MSHIVFFTTDIRKATKYKAVVLTCQIASTTPSRLTKWRTKPLGNLFGVTINELPFVEKDSSK